MSNEIDWSKAPEGATYFGPETQYRYAAWYKKVEGLWRCWRYDGGSTWFRTIDLPDSLIPRLVEWNGTGLPPVGTVCEGNEYGEWVRLEVIAHYEGRAVCMLPCKERVALADPGMLRPIRTPEQIAAEKREREIMEIEQVILHAHYGLDDMDAQPSERARAYARALHYFFKNKTEQEQDQ